MSTRGKSIGRRFSGVAVYGPSEGKLYCMPSEPLPVAVSADLTADYASSQNVESTRGKSIGRRFSGVAVLLSFALVAFRVFPWP